MNDTSGDAVGYGHPPRSTRFKRGQSGNPKGRPRGSHRSIPYESVLGQRVTIREDGRERRVTAAEAFLLQLTRKGLQGDSAAARASLTAIEVARAKRGEGVNGVHVTTIVIAGFGVSSAFEPLGIAVQTDPFDEQKVRWRLQPWIVEAALARLGSRRLTVEEQREVWGATRNPSRVQWPEWWKEHRPPDGPNGALRKLSDADL